MFNAKLPYPMWTLRLLSSFFISILSSFNAPNLKHFYKVYIEGLCLLDIELMKTIK